LIKEDIKTLTKENQKSINEDFQFIDNEKTVNIMNIVEPKNSIKGHSEYSNEKDIEEKKGI